MSKQRKTRGQSYDRNRLQELMDKDLTPKEIADELGTKSVQSIRHSMEDIQRKTDAIRAYKNRQRMEEEKVNSMNRVGLFPYVADELSIKALKYLLPLSETGLSIVKTDKGYVILVDPETDLESVRGKLSSLGIYGRLCSKKDGGKQIRITRKPSSDEKIPWAAMIETPFIIGYREDDELEKLQVFLYPYLEDGRTSSIELNRTMLTVAEDPEYTLKSMQFDADNSQFHLHIEYDPLFVTRFGYVPFKLKENNLELISKETLNNLGNLVYKEILKDKDQFIMRLALHIEGGPDRKAVEQNANFEAIVDHLRKIIENIPIFMTKEIGQKLEKEIEKNEDYLNEMLEQTLSYLNGMNISEFM